MKIENTEISNFAGAFRGMRNPMNSWDKSDSNFKDNQISIGPNDMKLARSLIEGGSEHRKFLRQIFVSFDLTAPLYIWKEFDTYKVGTVANSCSTMHKLASTPIALDCFEIDDLNLVPYDESVQRKELKYNIDPDFIQMALIPYLEYLRQKYNETKEIVYWKELIRWLPESWLQKRTITLNYENLRNIYHQRKNHKLTEWHTICKWIETLPYAQELIIQ